MMLATPFFPMCLNSHIETEEVWIRRLCFHSSETYSHQNMLDSVHGQSELLCLFKGRVSASFAHMMHM